jgi:hypothetical protein
MPRRRNRGRRNRYASRSHREGLLLLLLQQPREDEPGARAGTGHVALPEVMARAGAAVSAPTVRETAQRMRGIGVFMGFELF